MKAAQHRINEKYADHIKIDKLKRDILNEPKHFLSYHSNCENYFRLNTNDINLYNEFIIKDYCF